LLNFFETGHWPVGYLPMNDACAMQLAIDFTDYLLIIF
jgi:hypothetical protein